MTRPVGLSPAWLQANFTDVDGLPLSGGHIWTFVTNGDETAATYADANGTIQNPNPIVLDSAGRLPVQIYLLGGQLYRFVLEDVNNNYITEINNVAAPRLLAGENITLDPPSGIGPIVTITAQGPSNINDYGQGPTYMWAGVSNGAGVPLNGTDFGDFTTIQKVPEAPPATPETEIDGNFILGNVVGSYTVVFTVKLMTPIGGSEVPIAWPLGQTVFGTRFASGDGFLDHSMHTRYSAFEYDNIGTEYQVVTFVDTYTFSVDAPGYEKPFYLYALSSFDQNYTPLLASFEVQITRFGEPYDATWPTSV